MMGVSPLSVVSVGLVLFHLGLLTIILRKNLLLVLMGIELALNGISLIWVAMDRADGSYINHVAVLFIMSLAACESAIGLALAVGVFSRFQTIHMRFFQKLRG